MISKNKNIIKFVFQGVLCVLGMFVTEIYLMKVNKMKIFLSMNVEVISWMLIKSLVNLMWYIRRMDKEFNGGRGLKWGDRVLSGKMKYIPHVDTIRLAFLGD